MTMSELPPPGYWLAADGRWYPPHLHPALAADEPGSVLASRLTILISALVVVLGSFLPWAQVFGVSVSGMDGDGKITIILGLLTALLAAGCWSRERSVGVALGVIAGLFGLGTLVVAGYDWGQMQGTVVSAGTGLILVGLGSVGVIVGCILAFVRH